MSFSIWRDSHFQPTHGKLRAFSARNDAVADGAGRGPAIATVRGSHPAGVNAAVRALVELLCSRLNCGVREVRRPFDPLAR